MWAEFKSWAAQPFDLTNMSLLDWWLLFGVLILISLSYGLLIRTATEVA